MRGPLLIALFSYCMRESRGEGCPAIRPPHADTTIPCDPTTTTLFYLPNLPANHNCPLFTHDPPFYCIRLVPITPYIRYLILTSHYIYHFAISVCLPCYYTVTPTLPIPLRVLHCSQTTHWAATAPVLVPQFVVQSGVPTTCAFFLHCAILRLYYHIPRYVYMVVLTIPALTS